MCGIVGYVGSQMAVPVLIEGLRKLEYRGYDSAGIAVLEPGNGIAVERGEGKLAVLEAQIHGKEYIATTGIGHTRWATHGRPSVPNAHPHKVGRIALVHNGIIENYIPLRERMIAAGRTMNSETDTEVIAHLIDERMQQGDNAEAALRHVLGEVRGAYALGLVCEDAPDVVYAARKACPLVVGMGEGENFIASDIPAILAHTRRVIYLDDGEVAVLTADGVTVTRVDGTPVTHPVNVVDWNPVMAEKAGFKHFMLKEIHEQPSAISDTMMGRVTPDRDGVLLPEMEISDDALRALTRITIVACGTSWHAGLAAKYMIEAVARLPVEVDIASEYRYRDPLTGPGELILTITQSGETADTLAAMQEARKKGATLLTVCNVVGSSAARAADGVVYTHAGPEIGVASTKAFTTQLVALYLFAVHLGRVRGTLGAEGARELLDDLARLPGQVKMALAREDEAESLAKQFFRHRDFLFLGRGSMFPIALEGALKLKEISYIHAEAYAAGEMKHGPIALIDEEMPVVMLAPPGPQYEKVVANAMEVKARDGIVIAVVDDADTELSAKVDAVLRVPMAGPFASPALYTIPLQFLAYHIAVLRGCDVDQPRNLAKSVTVE
ncbi:MAG: glutamine--fructose-6-phosphate transaminase (isomerizing) [Nitrospirota bacterium]|nr:glutamine--fructose-6-phosphate transaminase (isomerizing) [Nitrospirota bacterium]